MPFDSSGQEPRTCARCNHPIWNTDEGCFIDLGPIKDWFHTKCAEPYLAIIRVWKALGARP